MDPAAVSRHTAALTVYRAQLIDLAHEKERGVVSDKEAAALEAEIQTRGMLKKIAGTPEPKARSWTFPTGSFWLRAVLVDAGWAGDRPLYLLLG